MKTRHTSIYPLLICMCLASFRGMAQNSNQTGIEILQQPVFEPVCAGEGTSLSVQVSGSGLSYQWQVLRNWGNYEDLTDTQGYSGTHTAQLNIASLSKSMNQQLYHCKITRGTEEQFTIPVVVTLKNAIINIDPANGTGYAGDYHSIEVYATGEGLKFQWQVDKGSGFGNIEDNGTFTGSKTSILSIPEVAKKMEGYHFRCIVSGNACEAATLISNATSLTVSTSPDPLKSVVSGNPANVIWFMHGMSLPVYFHGSPNGVGVYVDGAVKLVNNAQILSQALTGCQITMAGHLYNENTVKPLLKEGDISQFIFSGGDAQQIIGGNATFNNFYKIQLNKTAGTALSLNNDISFRGNLEFASGNLALNGKKTYFNYVNESFVPQPLSSSPMVPFPTIINETDNKRILGASGGSVIISNQYVDPNSSPFATDLNLGNMGAEIKDQSNNFGGRNITFERQHTTSNSNGTSSIQRLYKISSNADTPVPANMDFTFHYLDADLGGANESTLNNIFKSDNNGATWAAQTTNVVNTTLNFAKQNQVEDITTWWTLFPCLNLPTVTFTEGPVKHLCDGVNYTIAPTITPPAVSYVWLLNGVVTPENGPTYPVIGDENLPNQQLVLKAFNAAGCFKSDTLTLIHEDALTVDLGPDRTFCIDDQYTYTVTIPNGINYTWVLEDVTVQDGPSGTYDFVAAFWPAGSWDLEVTASTAWCSVEDVAVVTVDLMQVLVNNGADIDACEPGTATLEVNFITPGIAPYDYNWNNGASTISINVNINSNANYSVTVTDDAGCTSTDQINIFFSDLVLTETHTNIMCFGESTGAIDLTVAGNYGNLSYDWSTNVYTEDQTGLPAGTYDVTVYDQLPSSYCNETMSITLTEPPFPLSANGVPTSVLCYGDNTGEIDLQIYGGTPGYTYLWSNGATTQDLTGLYAGTYSVTVTDANLCTTTNSTTVTEFSAIQPSTNPPPVVTNVSCHGAGDGAISWDIIGGQEPYSYSWTGPGGPFYGEDLINLVGGTYNASVTDGNGCTYTTSFNVNEPDALAATITPTNVICFGTNSGSILLDPAGGTLPFTFSWTGPNGFMSTNQNITSLEAGDYHVTITDAHSCTFVPTTVTISGPGAPLTVIATTSNITCHGDGNGFITLDVTGGWTPYTFLWEEPLLGYASTSQNINMLEAGNYSLTVTDANNCTFTNVYVVTEPDGIVLNEVITDISCYCESDGSIALAPTGGTGSYDYNWVWAGGSSNASSITNLSGPTQSYAVTVTDGNNCETTASFTVVEPDPITATSIVNNPTCFGYADGGIYLTVAGGPNPGNPNYTFSWIGPNGYTANTEDITFLVAGDYSVTIGSAAGCDGPILNFTLTQPTLLVANPIITNPLECFGDSDGQINANPTGGIPPYTYAWVYPNGATASTQFISNLSQTGFYQIVVTDAHDCHTPYDPPIQIELTSPPIISISGVVTDVWIHGGSDGAIDLTVSGGTGSYDYLWSNGATTADISGLTSGTYTVYVTDDNNCIKTASFFVDEPALLTIGLDFIGNVSCNGGNNGFVTTHGIGGVPPYSFSWSNGGNTNQINNLVAGNYILTLTDAHGAVAIGAYTVTQPPPLLPNPIQVNISCNGAHNGSITLSPSGGTAPYGYLWTTGATTSSITGLGPGNYSVTITDNHGCTFLGTYTITEPAILVANAGPDVGICLGSSTVLNASGSGGTNPFGFLWSPATGLSATNIPNPVANPSVTTTYTVQITDAHGCIATDQVKVTVNSLPTASAGADVTICAGSSTVLNASGSGGGGNYGYLWGPATGLSATNIPNPTASPTVTTTYTVTVTDANGCTATDQVVVNVNPLPILVINGTNCSPNLQTYLVKIVSNGTVTASIGTVNYLGGNEYYVSGVPTGTDVTITSTFLATGCQVSQLVISPLCPCPVVDPPVSGGDQTICANNLIPPLTVTVNSNETADWYDAATGGNLLIAGNTSYTPLGAGTYFAEARNLDNNCISSTRTAVTLTIHPLPMVYAGADVAICLTSSTTLNAIATGGSGIYNYLWAPSSNLSDPTIPNPVASPTVTTLYTVTVTDGNGCSATDQVQVIVNPLPNIIVNSATCNPDFATYYVLITTNASAVSTTAGVLTNQGAGVWRIDDILTGTAITLTATNTATGCSVQQGINSPNCVCPIVNPPVSSGDQTICEGSPIPALTVTVTPNETVDWYAAPTGNNLLYYDNTSYTPSGAGTYYAEARNYVNSCVSTTRTPVTLTINAAPVANAGPNATACPGINIQLNAGGSTGIGGLSYSWTPATGLNNPNIVNPIANVTNTTTYTVQVTNGAGCTATDGVVVTAAATPSMVVAPPVCAPNLLTYEVTITTNANTVTVNAGVLTNNGGGSFSIIAIPTGQNLAITATNTATGCVLLQTVTAPDCSCPFLATPLSNGDEELCEGDSIHVLTVLVGPGETADWYDAPTGGNLLLANNTEYLPTAAGIFYAEARNTTTACTSSRVALSLTILPLPVIVFDDPADLCAGSLPITLSASPVGGTFSGVGVIGDQFDPVVGGIGVHGLVYSYTDGNGCMAFAVQNIEVFALPSVVVGSNSPVCDGGDLYLTESNANSVAWAWNGPNGFASTEQNPIIPMLAAIGTGIYEVTITSSEGCSNTGSTSVALNPALGLGLDPAASFCPGGNVQLAALPTGGAGLFDFVWAAPSGGTSTGQSLLADEGGTWSIVVTDGNGCTISGTVDVTELPAMAVIFTSTDASCNGSDGTLTANVTGGLAPYSYEWDGLSNTTSMLTGVPAGGYQLMVTDANGCMLTATSFVGNADAPVVTINSIVDVLCAGAATGSITVNVMGGVLPYSFNWSNGKMTQNINLLTAGQYGLEVTDASGCIVNNVYQVMEPPVIMGVLATTQTATPTSGDGAIDLTVSGGVPPYQFAWSNGLFIEDISNLFVGPYSVSITDANGCTLVENATVTAVGALAVNLVGQNISCNGSGDGSVEAVITGGTAPYTVLWSTGSNLTVISDLLPGSYQVTVSSQNGSTATGSITLTQPPLLQSFTQKTDNTCNGESAGTANVFASGGTMPFTYEWSNGQTTQAANGLQAGVYTVIVTDAHGCTNQQSVTIGEPSAIEIAINAVIGNECFGDMEGTIDISVTGGVSPYFANWSQGATTQDVSSLAAGNYAVTITDFQACTTTASVVVDGPSEIMVDFTATAVTCFGEANGSLTANASGGTPGITGYQFLWTNGQAAATIDNLVSGNYFLTVTDELGCTKVANIYLAQPDLLLGNLTIENITCFGLANGSVQVQPTGGTVPYTYLWTNSEVDSLLEDLDIGNYSVVITDANGCSTTEATQITQPDLLTVVATVTDLNCFNDFSGAINLDISGGTPIFPSSYNVAWDIGQFTEDINQLEAGDYIFTVLDDNSCQVMDTITVHQPDALVAVPEINNISCFGGSDGSIDFVVSGGIAPYSFNWQNGATTPGVNGLLAGNYTFTITDDLGCVIGADIDLTQPQSISLAYQIQRAGCKTNNDGGIDITVDGGEPAYTFIWSNGAVSEDVSQLTAGTYTVTVMDDNGCTVSQSLGVASTPNGSFEAFFLAATGLFDVDSVEVNSDDIIQFVDVSYPAPTSWEWNFGDPDSTTSDLPNPAFSYPNDNTVAQSSYMATLIASNLFCTDTMTKQIWITNNFRLNGPGEDSLGYLTFTDILAYPNPTSGMVTLDIKLSREEKVRLYVVDVLGQILKQDELEGDDHYTTKLDFKDLAPGIYFINLRSVNQVHTVKIVVSDE